jgi:outer membrane protein with beta-barrel domain
MKKGKRVLFLIGVFFTSIIYAQNGIRIGLNAGATYSKFRGNELIENTDAKIDFLIGVSFEYSLKENLSLKTNLNYERKSFVGVKTIGFIPVEIKVTSNFDYLSFPILIEYDFGNSQKLFVNGGPFIGFLLSGKSKAGGFPTNDLTSLNKKLDIGLSFGIGKKFYLNDKNNLNVEIRENLGLINISDVEVINDGSIKTNSLNLILTWDFEI